MTWGLGTCGLGDLGTWGLGDLGTGGLGDWETGGLGDLLIFFPAKSSYSCATLNSFYSIDLYLFME